MAMGALLVAMSIVTVATLLWSRSEIDHIQSKIVVSDAYHQTAFYTAMATVHWNGYQATQDPAELQDYQAALTAAFENEARAKALGDAEDRQYLEEMEALYADQWPRLLEPSR